MNHLEDQQNACDNVVVSTLQGCVAVGHLFPFGTLRLYLGQHDQVRSMFAVPRDADAIHCSCPNNGGDREEIVCVDDLLLQKGVEQNTGRASQAVGAFSVLL